MPELVYLDNAATSWPKPASVGPAMAAAVEGPLGSPGRGGSAIAARAGRIVADLRERLAARVGASDPRRIVLTSGATESLNIAVQGVVGVVGVPGERSGRALVVTTVVEHNSLRRPLEHLAAAGRIDLVVVGCDSRGAVDAAAVLAAAGGVDGRTALVAMSHASNVTGTIQPVEAVGRGLRERFRGADGPLFLVDASPTVGLLEIRAQEWGIDLVAFCGHKGLLGPAGIGGLYVSERAYHEGAADPGRERLRPTRWGGTGVDSLSAAMPEEMPLRFEPGTPNVPGMAGLLGALDDASREPDGRVLAHERAMAVRLIELLEEHARGKVRILGTPEPARRTGVVAVTVAGCPPTEVAAVLEQSFGVVTRAGLHCAPGVHRALGTLEGGGAVRISPGPATTEREIETAARGIVELCRAGG